MVRDLLRKTKRERTENELDASETLKGESLDSSGAVVWFLHGVGLPARED